MREKIIEIIKKQQWDFYGKENEINELTDQILALIIECLPEELNAKNKDEMTEEEQFKVKFYEMGWNAYREQLITTLSQKGISK